MLAQKLLDDVGEPRAHDEYGYVEVLEALVGGGCVALQRPNALHGAVDVCLDPGTRSGDLCQHCLDVKVSARACHSQRDRRAWPLGEGALHVHGPVSEWDEGLNSAEAELKETRKPA